MSNPSLIKDVSVQGIYRKGLGTHVLKGNRPLVVASIKVCLIVISFPSKEIPQAIGLRDLKCVIVPELDTAGISISKSYRRGQENPRNIES